jgi:zinc transport system permease protein
MDNFIIYVLIAGAGLAVSASIIGCFVVWRKMAYFADSMSHSSLLGIAIGLFFAIDFNVAVLMVALLFAGFLLILEQKKIIANDSLLGVLSYGFLAVAVIIINSIDLDIDLHSYLFGDILAIGLNDIYFIYSMLVVVLLFVVRYWHELILLTLNEDIARAEGVPVFLLKLVFMLILAFFVALSVQFVGALLIGAMLIIPVASARFVSKSALFMLGVSILINIISIISGVFLSMHFDTPTGPSIVAISAAIFVVLFAFYSFKK